jgi:hypothetical protein
MAFASEGINRSPTQRMPAGGFSAALRGRRGRGSGPAASYAGVGRFLVPAVGGDAEAAQATLLAVFDDVPHLRLDQLLELREQAGRSAAAGGAGGGFAPINPAAALHPERELVEEDQRDCCGRDDEEDLLRQLLIPPRPGPSRP